MLEARIQAMSVMERVQRAASLTVLAHRVALAEIARRHPDESDREHRLRLASRYVDPSLMKAAFGWPAEDGS